MFTVKLHNGISLYFKEFENVFDFVNKHFKLVKEYHKLSSLVNLDDMQFEDITHAYEMILNRK